jgi:hypothetical protein
MEPFRAASRLAFKKKGRDYSRSAQALVCPQGTLSARPIAGVLQAPSLVLKLPVSGGQRLKLTQMIF